MYSTLTKPIFLLVIFFGSLSAVSQTKHNLTINFKGFKSSEGKIYVGLHDKEENFLKVRCKEAVAEIIDNSVKVVFNDVNSGEYAVSAFHDENDNHKLDTNFIGIPKEPIGISNDAKGFMGPPKFKDAKFTVDSDKTIQIEIQ